VEAHAYDVEIELLGLRQEARNNVEGCPKLDPERTQALGIVGQDPNDELSAGVSASDLIQLVGVVESHHVHTLVRGIANEGNSLARVGEDDAGRVDPTDVEDLGDFIERRAVKACAEGGEKSDDVGVGVALDSWRVMKENEST
jgi:hypothetical protein